MAHKTPLALLLSSALLVSPSLAHASTFASLVQDTADAMTPEAKIERAKALFAEGDAAFQGGNFETALAKFEEAYNVYAPEIHVFNINIGLAAYEMKDCVKAKKAFQRFLDLVPDHPARSQAQEKLLEIERSGCAQTAPEPEPEPVTTTPAEETTSTAAAYPVQEDYEDAPVLTSSSKERQAQAERERRAMNAKKKPLLIAGSVLTGLGVAILAGGGVTLALAIRDQNRLEELSSPGVLGFPTVSYATEEPFDLDRNQLPIESILAPVFFGVGGAFAGAGIAMIVVHVVKKKRQGGNAGAAEDKAWMDGGPRFGLAPTWMPGGGGAAAHMRF